MKIKQGRDFVGLVLNPVKSNIVIVSKQLLDDYVLDKTVVAIQQLDLDLIVFDENHFHGTTEMAKNILLSYSSPKTKRLYLTATFMKPLNEWNIPECCRFYWDLEDEQMCKSRDITGLIEKHGEDVKIFLTNETRERELSVYDKMPDLHILTNQMEHERYEEIKRRIKYNSYGFSNSCLFCGQYPDEVDLVLRYITGSEKETDYIGKDGDQSLFGRIKRMSISANSRTRLNNSDFTSQLWFLPFGVGMKIDAVSQHLRDRMMKNRILKNYEVKIVNSTQTEYKMDDLKEQIDQWEINAKTEGKTGLILLAGNQLTLGITLPMVDIVFLMNDVQSSDKIVQMMYRCMTEGLSNCGLNRGEKKIGFVVDLNISRVLNTLLDYDIYKKDLSTEEKIKYIVKRHLISIDADLFKNHENKKELVKCLLDVWKANPEHHFKTLLYKIQNEVILLDTPDQQKINQLYFSKGCDKVNIQIKMDDENEDALQTGLVITNTPVVSNEDTKEEKSDDKNNSKIIQISITKDILPYVIPLICILTMNTPNRDILEMLNAVRINPTLLAVFEDQSFIWWNRPDVIKLIEAIVSKYVKKNSTIYNIAIQFKLSLQSLIDRPKELLELIDQCLKPKKLEKDKFGEVFTPMYLVNEMLDQLDQHYSVEHEGQSIFVNPNLTWFDPATGMGNFPVAVYLRLMSGLQQVFPVDEERKCHILEKMLYMSELNKKNVFICREIFNIDGKFKLNLYEGDTLALDVKQEWNIKAFDIVLGNPPYNKSKDGTLKGGYGGRSLWDKFVVKSLNGWLKPECYLLFIHPPSWRKPEHYLWKVIGTKQLLYLKTYSKKEGQKIFGCSTLVDYYVLKNSGNYKETVIDGQDGKTYSVSLDKWNFLPSGAIDEIQNIIGKNEIIYSRTIYGTDKKNISKTKNEKNKLPVVHNMTKKDGLGFVYSSEDKGHFNVPKVILSFGEFQYPYNDWKGEYGMSQICFGIKISSKDEGDFIVEAINSPRFKEVLKYTKWSTFQTDWRMFNEFKPDFWKSFIEPQKITQITQQDTIVEPEPE